MCLSKILPRIKHFYERGKPKRHTEINLILTLDVVFALKFKYALFWLDIVLF